MNETESNVATWVRVFVREKSKSKGPGAGVCSVQLRNHEEILWLEQRSKSKKAGDEAGDVTMALRLCKEFGFSSLSVTLNQKIFIESVLFEPAPYPVSHFRTHGWEHKAFFLMGNL